MRRRVSKTLRASGKIPDHPLVGEVMKDVLTEAMDVEGLKTLLRGMASGEIRVLAVDTPVPSQFSHEILNANPYAYLDDAPLEERRARAVEMRRVLPESVLEEVGGLDPGAIAQVREEAWPDVRDADELHDVLHTLVALPEDRVVTHRQQLGVQERFQVQPWRAIGSGLWHGLDLRATGESRGGRDRLTAGGRRRYWVAAERARSFSALFPGAQFEQRLADVETARVSRDDALLTLVTGMDVASGTGDGFAAWRCCWGCLLRILRRLCCGWRLAGLFCGESLLAAAGTRRRGAARHIAGASPRIRTRD